MTIIDWNVRTYFIYAASSMLYKYQYQARRCSHIWLACCASYNQSYFCHILYILENEISYAWSHINKVLQTVTSTKWHSYDTIVLINRTSPPAGSNETFSWKLRLRKNGSDFYGDRAEIINIPSTGGPPFYFFVYRRFSIWAEGDWNSRLAFWKDVDSGPHWGFLECLCPNERDFFLSSFSPGQKWWVVPLRSLRVGEIFFFRSPPRRIHQMGLGTKCRSLHTA